MEHLQGVTWTTCTFSCPGSGRHSGVACRPNPRKETTLIAVPRIRGWREGQGAFRELVGMSNASNLVAQPQVTPQVTSRTTGGGGGVGSFACARMTHACLATTRLSLPAVAVCHAHSRTNIQCMEFVQVFHSVPASKEEHSAELRNEIRCVHVARSWPSMHSIHTNDDPHQNAATQSCIYAATSNMARKKHLPRRNYQPGGSPVVEGTLQVMVAARNKSPRTVTRHDNQKRGTRGMHHMPHHTKGNMIKSAWRTDV